MAKIPYQFRGANGRVCCTGYVDKPFSQGGQISLDGLCADCRERALKAIPVLEAMQARQNKATAKTARVASPVTLDRPTNKPNGPSKTIVNSRGEFETLTGEELAVYNGENNGATPQKKLTPEELVAWCKSEHPKEYNTIMQSNLQPNQSKIRPLPDPWGLAAKGINLDGNSQNNQKPLSDPWGLEAILNPPPVEQPIAPLSQPIPMPTRSQIIKAAATSKPKPLPNPWNLPKGFLPEND